MSPPQNRRRHAGRAPDSGEPPPDPAQREHPNPSPSPAAASPAADLSTGSSAAEVADPGPAFDRRSAPAAPPVEPEVVGPPELWEEATIRSLLETQGNATHYLLRVGPEDTETWKHTQADLGAIAPPLTRILNRYDATRAAAAAGDEIALIAAVGTYGVKNYSARRRLLAARAAEAGPQPITGVPAPEESGPEHDEQWAQIHEMPPAITPKGAHHR